jgi:hypothetical protein
MSVTSRPQDGWRHRRRLIYATVGLAFTMMLVAMVDFTDRAVSSQLVIGAVTLLSLTLSSYVFAATYEDTRKPYDDGH